MTILDQAVAQIDSCRQRGLHSFSWPAAKIIVGFVRAESKLRGISMLGIAAACTKNVLIVFWFALRYMNMPKGWGMKNLVFLNEGMKSG